MKFHWFNLMPYPSLPDDFRERYSGVWVDVLSAELYDPAKGHAVYNEYLDELEFAEREGFDGICVNEHHQNAYGLMPLPNLIAAALTRRTSRGKLVVLDVSGFPVGTPMDSVYCYGENPATLREKYREGVDLIRSRRW